MDNLQKILKIENAINILEDVKSEIENERDMRTTSFVEQCLSSIFHDKVPYTLRQRLIELYKDYNILSSGSDEWYGFSYQSEKEFAKVIKEIRL